MAAGGFAWYDVVIFSLTLVISLGIGLYYAFKGDGQRTTQDYLMGGRTMKTIPVALSMVMSYISAILVLGNTAEMYTWGVQVYLTAWGACIAYALSAMLFVPLFFPLRLTSSFEYIQMRFESKVVRLTGTVFMMVSQCLYMGIAMYSPATALDAATGFPTWASVLLTGVVGTIYTTLGGMKAVIWTDVFQAGVMVGGIIAVLVVGTQSVGGFPEVWDIAGENGRLELFDFNPSPLVRQSFWTNMIGTIVSSSQVMTSQMSIQRFSSLPTLSQGRICLLLNIPGTLIMWTLTCLTGLVVFAHYNHKGCDPLRTNLINSPTQLLPFFIIDNLQSRAPGLPGLFVAVLFSGALSTLSSSLNALAAVTWKDLLENKFGNIPESRKALVSKVLVAMYGVIAVACAFAVPSMGEHVSVASSSFVSGVSGPLLGIFLLGAFFPFVNWIGALSGAWTGLAFSMAIALGSNIESPYRVSLPTIVANCTDIGPDWNVTKPIPDNPTDVPSIFLMSYQWFAALGTMTCLVVGIIVSLITGPTAPRDVDPRLIVPWVDRLCCYLPAKVRRLFYFGVDHESVRMTKEGFYPDVLERAQQEVEERNRNTEEQITNISSLDKDMELSTVQRNLSKSTGDMSHSQDNDAYATIPDQDQHITTYL